jgi:hypothetical protein
LQVRARAYSRAHPASIRQSLWWGIMLSHHPAASTAITRGPASISQSLARLASVLIIATALAGCTAARTAPVAASDPSDPGAPAASARYQPVLSGYVSQRPVGPKPWREQNERVTPKGSAQ